jgi:hypothetical protein
LSNPPAYYNNLNEKQKKNWRKTTKKLEKNEKLKQQYPPFYTSSNIKITYIHYQSTITTIDELIKKAKETRRYVIDTESEKGKREKQVGLIQIQFVHSTTDSTIILIETNYLPDPQSNLFTKIKELCGIIFNNNNEIISWGPVDKEFEHFNHLDLIHLGKIKEIDLQFLFSNQHNNLKTHPEMERRDDLTRYTSNMYDTPGDNDTHDNDEQMDYDYDDDGYTIQYNSNQPISLQDAIATTFGKFIDKSLTVNYWQCGIDLNLNTWRNKLFSRPKYDRQTEQQQREAMKQYAINDCTSVAELYFHMYPSKANDHKKPETSTTASTNILINLANDHYKPETPTPTPTTASTNKLINLANDLSDISEDELIEILKPKFNKKQKTIELKPPDQQPLEQPQELPTQQRTKSEKQKRKNEKLKWKQQNQPNFQNKIKRPIYYRYDYRKIRAQLLDDNIFTSRQITINHQHSEVVIGFKSKEELEHATKIMRINYFSKNQYYDRWGSTKKKLKKKFLKIKKINK